MNIGGDLPAKGLVQQIVLGGGAEVLAAPDHVGNAHQMVVHHVGEVVGGQAVPLQQDLVVQGLILHGDVAEADVVEGSGALVGDPLADDVGLARRQIGPDLLRTQVPAGIVRPFKVAGVLLGFRLFAEAVIGRALFHQQLRVLAVQVAALRLDIGTHGASHIGTLVVSQAAFGHGAVNDLRRALYLTALVRVLQPEDERAAGLPGDEPGVQRGAEIAHVHIAGGGGGKPGPDLSLGDAGLHIIEKLHIKRHVMTSILEICVIQQIALWPFPRKLSRKTVPESVLFSISAI